MRLVTGMQGDVHASAREATISKTMQWIPIYEHVFVATDNHFASSANSFFHPFTDLFRVADRQLVLLQ
jgi:hypothetical protein